MAPAIHVLAVFSEVVPPVEEVTLFDEDEIEGYLKEPDDPGYKNPYRL